MLQGFWDAANFAVEEVATGVIVEHISSAAPELTREQLADIRRLVQSGVRWVRRQDWSRLTQNLRVAVFLSGGSSGMIARLLSTVAEFFGGGDSSAEAAKPEPSADGESSDELVGIKKTLSAQFGLSAERLEAIPPSSLRALLHTLQTQSDAEYWSCPITLEPLYRPHAFERDVALVVEEDERHRLHLFFFRHSALWQWFEQGRRDNPLTRNEIGDRRVYRLTDP